MECIYNINEFCTNDKCPMRGDYCPVPDTDGVCKYEARQEERWTLTPKGCFIAALDSNDVHIEDGYLDAVWKDFVALMSRCGYLKEEN